MKSVEIPSSLTDISYYAFYQCPSLTHVSAFGECKSLKKVILPASVEKIKDNAFCQCSELKDIDIPSSVESLCLGVFSNCSKLTKDNLT